MSIALATKGMIAGFGGIGGGGGEGGIYPTGYVASAIQIDVDLGSNVVSVAQEDIQVAVELDDGIGVAVAIDDTTVSVTQDEESVGVNVCNE